jgi:hypothetical protein
MLRHQRQFSRLLEEDLHLDANEAGFVFPQLEAVQAEAVRKEYAKTVARSLVPTDHSVPSWAESWAYYEVDERGGGGPTIITHMTDELPEAAVNLTKVTAGIHTIGKGYSYSLDEVQAAVRGFNLPVEKAGACRRAMERDLDEIAAVGHDSAGLEGFITHSLIPNTTGMNGDWANATAAEILEDIYTVVTTVRLSTKGNHVATDLAVPLSSMVIIETRPVDTTNQRKIVDVVRDTFPGLTITPWTKLEDANGAAGGSGTGPLIMAFEKSLENFKLVVPMEYTEEPPEKRNLGFRVPARIKTGGVAAIRPLAANRADIA